MVEVTEVTDTSQQDKKSTATAAYRGPGDDFPFMAFNILGGTHILLATAMIITGVIHIALGDMDRLYFLLTGGVSLWCPLVAMATGIVGAVISDRRHWEVYCLKQAFLAMNIITAFLFMVPLAVVTGLVDFCYYGMTCVDIVTDYLSIQRGTETPDDRIALMWVIVALACLEFLVCILSACICCCCSPLYQEAESETQEQQIVIKQQSPPPIYVEKTPQPQPTIVVQKPTPRPQPIIVQAPPQPKPAPIIVQAPAPRPPPVPMIMAPPPPQPVYGALPGPRQPIYGAPAQPMYRSIRSVRRPRTTIM